VAHRFHWGLIYGETYPNGFWIRILLINWGISIAKNGKYNIQFLFKGEE